MKRIISLLIISTLFLASCSKNDDVYYYDMHLAIEVVDNLGNDLLGNFSSLIIEGKTKMTIAGKDYYLNSPESNTFTFRHIKDNGNNYLKIGHWYADRKDFKITVDWGGNIEKDHIVFSYDSHVNGMESASHDFRYPYSIAINGKNLELNKANGHFIYVKEQ